MEQLQAETVKEARWQVASVLRDWLHETELSRCGLSADECPDWPLAYELADHCVAAACAGTSVSTAIRDWLHDTPLSECGASAEECPDWPLAYELAEKVQPLLRPVAARQQVR